MKPSVRSRSQSNWISIDGLSSIEIDWNRTHRKNNWIIELLISELLSLSFVKLWLKISNNSIEARAFQRGTLFPWYLKILFFLPCSPFRPTLLSKFPLAYVVEIHVPLRPQVNYRVPFNKFHFPVDFAAKFPLVVDIPFFLQVKFQKYIFFLGNKMIMFSCSPKPLEILTFVENSFLYFWDHIMHQCLFLPITWSLFKWFYSPNTIERNPSNCVWFWVWLPNSL